MRFKALGAVAALILVSTAFAATVFLRVQARGYATDSLNRRLDFQLNALKRSEGATHRYFGNGSFAWSVNGHNQSVRIHRLNSLQVEEGEDAVVITASGTGLLGQFGFPPASGRRGAPQLGDFTLTIVDNAEGADTIEFSFWRGSGVNAYTYHFSGAVQSGALNRSEWTL
ncbi:MAG: hypothetical protein WHS44_01970 [Fimbriimonadales bacterium]|nr:MAG: hypothetical protein KatS3mg018_0518 [Fimbriimonadales bacterium]